MTDYRLNIQMDPINLIEINFTCTFSEKVSSLRRLLLQINTIYRDYIL
jgi:hypothetical protein